MTVQRPHIIRPRIIQHSDDQLLGIEQCLLDANLLGAALGDPTTWATWIAVLKAAFGLPLSTEQLTAFATVAGARSTPRHRIRELWCVCGRRAGKSRMAAAVAVFLACFVKHRLSPGEVGMVLVLSSTVDQSKTVFSYAKAFLTASPVLRQEIDTITKTEIRLRSGIILAIHPNSFRSIRGRTLCACCLDDIALWRSDESATPDTETYTSLLPSLLTTRGMLIGISTGYRKTGLLYTKYRDHFGQDSIDTLVVQGSTLQFNTSLSARDLEAQRAADPSAAASEWDGSFRDDIAGFLSDELIDSAVELPPMGGSVYYRAFCDAAGGTGQDSYTIAIGHKEGERFVIDLVRGTSGKCDRLFTFCT
jgi:hypothetical protein